MTSSPEWLVPEPAVAGIHVWEIPPVVVQDDGPTIPPVDPIAEAYRRGWREGQAARDVEWEPQQAAVMAACGAARQAMQDAADLLRHQMVATVHALSVAIARHLLEWEVSQDPTHVRQLVARAVALAPLDGPITVRLHPDDLVLLQTIGGVIEATGEGLALHWIGDADVSRGGCVLEGPASIVDGRVDRALLDIYERLNHD